MDLIMKKTISTWLSITCKKLRCNLVYQYSSGMIIVKLKTTKGLEDYPTILLQKHMDMVLAKTSDCMKDLLVNLPMFTVIRKLCVLGQTKQY